MKKLLNVFHVSKFRSCKIMQINVAMKYNTCISRDIPPKCVSVIAFFSELTTINFLFIKIVILTFFI